MQRHESRIYAKRRTKISPRKRDQLIDDEGDDFQEQNLRDTEVEKSESVTSSDIVEDVSVETNKRTVVFKRRGLMDELEQDITSFNAPSQQNTSGDENGFKLGSQVKDVLSAVLIADFFAILVFLVWFIAASVSKQFFGNAFLLERFQDIFNPVIQPALGLLMVGSVASGLIKGDDKDKDK